MTNWSDTLGLGQPSLHALASRHQRKAASLSLCLVWLLLATQPSRTCLVNPWDGGAAPAARPRAVGRGDLFHKTDKNSPWHEESCLSTSLSTTGLIQYYPRGPLLLCPLRKCSWRFWSPCPSLAPPPPRHFPSISIPKRCCQVLEDLFYGREGWTVPCAVQGLMPTWRIFFLTECAAGFYPRFEELFQAPSNQ